MATKLTNLCVVITINQHNITFLVTTTRETPQLLFISLLIPLHSFELPGWKYQGHQIHKMSIDHAMQWPTPLSHTESWELDLFTSFQCNDYIENETLPGTMILFFKHRNQEKDSILPDLWGLPAVKKDKDKDKDSILPDPWGLPVGTWGWRSPLPVFSQQHLHLPRHHQTPICPGSADISDWRLNIPIIVKKILKVFKLLIFLIYLGVLQRR